MKLFTSLATGVVAAVATAGLFLAAPGAPAQSGPGLIGIPRGMVAFFQVPNCPPGWREVPASWRGRYFVMARDSVGTQVGNALGEGENRATGEHGHGTGVAFYGGNCSNNCGAWSGAGGINRAPVPINSTTPVRAGETIGAGTNAPYVTLRACARQ